MTIAIIIIIVVIVVITITIIIITIIIVVAVQTRYLLCNRWKINKNNRPSSANTKSLCFDRRIYVRGEENLVQSASRLLGGY